MKRKTKLQARNSLSSTKPASTRRKPAKRQRVSDKRWRSPAYLAFVRSLPCSLCGAFGCDPHHVIGLGWGLSGMGLTAPDSFAMAACRTCHRKIHNEPALQQMQPTWLRWTIRTALAEDMDTKARAELTHALAFIEAREEIV